MLTGPFHFPRGIRPSRPTIVEDRHRMEQESLWFGATQHCFIFGSSMISTVYLVFATCVKWEVETKEILAPQDRVSDRATAATVSSAAVI